MNNTLMTETNCIETLRRLDVYLDRELDAETSGAILRHLDVCPSCTQELELRRRVRSRLKTAVDAVPVSPYLQTRVLAGVRAAGQRRGGWLRHMAVATAALAVVSMGAGIAYQLGHLRLTVDSQERYITSISGKVAGIMSVGLKDHVHCTVFRKFGQNPPTLDKMRENLGSEYQGLVELVQPHIPKGFRLMMGHKCKYRGRQYIHLALKDDSRLISLVLTRRLPGEKFETSELLPVVAQSATPVYDTHVQRFDISGFETRDHLAYIVSDLPRNGSKEMMLAMAPALREFLTKLEG